MKRAENLQRFSLDKHERMFDNGNMKCVASISTKSPLYQRWYRDLPDHARLCWDIMLKTGLRLSDALTLTKEECDAGYKIERKTKKRRRINFKPPPYIKTGLLIPNRNGQAYHRTTFEKIYKRDREALHFPAPLNAHSARKMYALALLQRTHDLTAVQRDLDHKYLSTTLLYLYGHPHITRKGRITNDARE